MQFPPFNRIIRRADAGNDTVLDEEEADPTFTALKNAFQHATKGIKMLDAGSGNGSSSSMVTMEEGRNAFEIAYLAADANAAQAQQPGDLGDEVRNIPRRIPFITTNIEHGNTTRAWARRRTILPSGSANLPSPFAFAFSAPSSPAGSSCGKSPIPCV